MGTMSIPSITSEPAAITAGDSLSWLIAVPGYPATSGWTLKYSFVNAAGVITLDSTAAGDDFLVEAIPTDTADYKAGQYQGVKYLEQGTAETLQRITLARLNLEVKPNLADLTAGTDLRSHAKKVLDAIEAVIEGRASKGDQETTIDGVTLKKMTAEQLITLHSRYSLLYQQEVQREKLNSGASAGGRLKMRL